MMDDEHQQIGPESAAPRHIPQHDRSPRMPAPGQLNAAPDSSTEELVRVLMNLDANPYGDMFRAGAEQVAARLLTSSWFAGVIASVKAEALRESARYFEYEVAPAWGGDATWISTGTHVADLVAEHLRDRAATLEADVAR